VSVVDGLNLFKRLRKWGETESGAKTAGWGYTLGRPDIPRWVGLVLLVAVIYLASAFPSELQPLPVIDTVPASGAVDVPLTTELEVQMGPGGFQQVFGEADPMGAVTYVGGAKEDPVPLKFSHQGNVVRASLPKPLQPGRHVQAAVRTRYGRDLVWTFYSTDQDPGPIPTPLP